MIYLDNHATTPCDSAVVESMVPYFLNFYGNSSSDHYFGGLASDAADTARTHIANLIGASTDEIIFTSGATESNNIAILGIGEKQGNDRLKRKKIVTTVIEHKSVLSPITALSNKGFEVLYLPIDNYGRIDVNAARDIITEDVLLLSIQLANSEIGTIQPIKDLSEIATKAGVIFHCDASQALGKVQINVTDLNIDLLSVSAHKIYGPKGIGLIWIRQGVEKLLKPLMFGGNSQGDLRPGTLPIPLIVGFGKACQLVSDNFVQENKRVAEFRNLFEELISNKIKGICINGAKDNRLTNNSNITFPSMDAEALLANMPDLIASTGSACESGSIEPSRVLLEIGLSPDEAYGSVRFGLGRYTTYTDIEKAVEEITNAYQVLSKF